MYETPMYITSESLKTALCFPFPERREMFEIAAQFLDQLNKVIRVDLPDFKIISITYGDSMQNSASAVVPWIQFEGSHRQKSRLLAMHKVMHPETSVEVFPPERIRAFQALNSRFFYKPFGRFLRIFITMFARGEEEEFERKLADLSFWTPELKIPTAASMFRHEDTFQSSTYCCMYSKADLEAMTVHTGYGHLSTDPHTGSAQMDPLQALRQQLSANLVGYMTHTTEPEPCYWELPYGDVDHPPWRKSFRHELEAEVQGLEHGGYLGESARATALLAREEAIRVTYLESQRAWHAARIPEHAASVQEHAARIQEHTAGIQLVNAELEEIRNSRGISVLMWELLANSGEAGTSTQYQLSD